MSRCIYKFGSLQALRACTFSCIQLRNNIYARATNTMYVIYLRASFRLRSGRHLCFVWFNNRVGIIVKLYGIYYISKKTVTATAFMVSIVQSKNIDCAEYWSIESRYL